MTAFRHLTKGGQSVEYDANCIDPRGRGMWAETAWLKWGTWRLRSSSPRCSVRVSSNREALANNAMKRVFRGMLLALLAGLGSARLFRVRIVPYLRQTATSK